MTTRPEPKPPTPQPDPKFSGPVTAFIKSTTKRLAHTLASKRRGEEISPMPGYKVTYPYGVRSNSYRAGYHTGEDYSTFGHEGIPVVAVVKGRVVESSRYGGTWGTAYGSIVVIEFRTIFTRRARRVGYCHLSWRYVEVGDSVVPGQVIGKSGNSGNSTGPHLHLECRHSPFRYGNTVSPMEAKKRESQNTGKRV